MLTIKGSKGFTLLEMIVVMGIMGAILASFTVYKRKQMEEIGREHLASAIVREVFGLLEFVKEDDIRLEDDSFIPNPLYDAENKTLSDTDARAKAYVSRTSNDIDDDIPLDNNDNFLQWDNDRSRGYYTSSSCKRSSSVKVAESNFFEDYLNCEQQKNKDDYPLLLERVDLVGDPDTLLIRRVDFFVRFDSGSLASRDLDKFNIGNYSSAFSKAFSHYGLSYTRADVVYRNSGAASGARSTSGYGNGWTLLKNSEGKVLSYDNFTKNMESFRDKQQLGIRFSFEAGVGKYLKADGSVGAEKLCWNSTAGTMTHCLKVDDDSKGRNDEDGIMHLTAETTDPGDKDHTVTGTLMANVVFQGEVFNAQTGIFEQALMTNPVITYESFGNTKGSSSVVIDDPENYTEDVADEPGSIQLPVQPCPTLPPDPDNPNLSTKKALMPRMVAAISSIVADAGKSESSDGSTANDSDFADFINSGENRTAAKGLLDHLSGVAIQVNLEKPSTIQDDYKGAYWIISATTGVYDNASGQAVSVINPSSLSVVLTSWCSSIPQPDWEDGGKGARPPKISP
ncbi:Tfp pilus assembly protein FimT/FimU [Pseudescherichia vulneris]